MIGCPRGEGGHPLAAMINAGCLRKWIPALTCQLTRFEVPCWNVTCYIGGGFVFILMLHSIWALKVLKYLNCLMGCAPQTMLLQLLTMLENEPHQQAKQ